jgi:carbon monoxide dehydrogenase subunit G
VIELEHSLEVDRPAVAAFDFLARPERFPEWQPGIRSVERTSSGPIGQGSTYAIVVEGPGGVTVHADGRVVVWDPPHSVEIEGASSLLRLDGSYLVEPRGPDACEVRIRTRLQPLGFLRFMEGRIRRELEAELPSTLQRLRAAIEAEPEP